MKVSVVTPTIRPEGLDVVARALGKQTFQDFEWLVCCKEERPFYTHEFYDWMYKEGKFEVIKDDFRGGFWTLNRAYNKLFKEAKGDIVVSLQDFIWIPEDALEKLVKRIKETDGVVSGIG